MKASRTLTFAPFLLLSACTIYVEDPGYTQEPHKPYWATRDHRINHDSSSFNQNNQNNQIIQGNTIVTENKFYKLDFGLRKTEYNDIKVSLYLLECEDPKSKDHCTKSPLNKNIGFTYAINDGYTGELLENKSVTTSEPQYIIKTKRNYPECLSITISNSQNPTINSKDLPFNESKVVGC